MFSLVDALEMSRVFPMERKEEVIVFLAGIPEEKFGSLDYLCKNILPNYNTYDKKFQPERTLMTSYVTNLVGKGFISKREPPFDPTEREEFSKKVVGEIINKGPRKTKSVFALTKSGREEFEKIKKKYSGGLKDEKKSEEG
ncbi:MAG: hypothetical protein V3574_04170 [Candidatus Moraniibacteriota bacterium]